MGVKQIFQQGMQEFKRQSSLRKEKKNLSQKENLLSDQLTALGRKAWESKSDIGGYGNSKELITNAQTQMDELDGKLSDLDTRKQELENKKKEENESFNGRRKEVEDKKKEVDNRLNDEKKHLKEAHRDALNVENRLKQIDKEEGQLKTKAAGAETSEEEKSQIRQKLDAFQSEKTGLGNKRDAASQTVKTQEDKIKPLEEESAAYQKEFNQIIEEQRNTIGRLDEALSGVNKEITDNKGKLGEISAEQNKNFNQLGEKLAAAQVTDEPVAEELAAVNDTKKDMEGLQVGIQSLEHQGSADSRGALWKMIGLIAAGVLVIVAIIILLSMLLGPKKTENPLVSVLSRGKESAAPPATMEDAQKKVADVTGQIKEQSEKMAGKKLVAADKAVLLSVLPDIGGWEIKNTRYSKQAFGQLEYAYLSAEYENSERKTIDVKISDTAAASMMLRTYKMFFRMSMNNEHENGYEKTTTVNDMPVIEKYTKKPPRASIVFVVKDRYLVEVRSRGETCLQLIKELVPKLDLSKLE